MTVAQDANGWTVVTETAPSAEGNSTSPAGTRKMYVDSSAADDTGDGSSGSPKKTIAAGMASIRANKPDWLLLKRGGTWVDQTIDIPANAGVSANEPMLVGTYSTGARPQLQNGNGDVVGTVAAGAGYVAIIGIDVYNDKRDPAGGRYTQTKWSFNAAGISTPNPFNWVLVEDCKVSFYNPNLLFNAANVTVSTRRNVIVDAYSCGAGGAAGLFAHGTTTSFLMEENLFDHNGWNENLASGVSVTLTAGTPGVASISSPNTPLSGMGVTFDSSGNGVTAGTLYFALNPSGTNFNISTTNDGSSGLVTFTGSGSNTATLSSPQSGFSHNYYMSAYSSPRSPSCPTTARGNIFARDASSGQFRGGGTVNNNLWVQAPIMSSFGMPTSFASTVTNNVTIHSTAALSGTGAGSGSGIDIFGNYNPHLDSDGYSFYNIGSVTVSNNIWAHRTFNAASTNCVEIHGYTQADVTITSASPGVVSGLEPMGDGQGIIFISNGDTLPTPLAFNTTYYAVNSAASPGTTFNIATTPAGSPINTSGGSGTHVGRLANSNTQNVTITANIFWDFFTGGTGTEINDDGGSNIVTGANVLHGNSATNDVGYPDPTRTVGGYYASIGNPGGFPSTVAGFLSAARLQSSTNWATSLMADSVNDFIRAGFGISDASSSTGTPRPKHGRIHYPHEKW